VPAVAVLLGTALLCTSACGGIEPGGEIDEGRSQLRQAHAHQPAELSSQLNRAHDARVEGVSLQRRRPQQDTVEGPRIRSATCGGASCPADDAADCVTVSYGPIIVCGCEVGGYRFICR